MTGERPRVAGGALPFAAGAPSLPLPADSLRFDGGFLLSDRRAAVYDIHTSLLAGGHIGPSPSSRCAAALLRFARYAVTAPFRCGEALP
jgi:hypothetical protein